MTQIVVRSPNFWWHAPAAHVRQMVPTDPDVADNRSRWHDRDDQRWALVARAVMAVSRALIAGSWAQVDSEEAGAVDADVSYLSKTELLIVRAWFSGGEAVRADPWRHSLGNGRHRLWSTMDYFADAPIPIVGNALGYANAACIPELGPSWSESFAWHLEELRALSWFNRADPVNRRFEASLETAARGGFPVPA